MYIHYIDVKHREGPFSYFICKQTSQVSKGTVSEASEVGTGVSMRERTVK